MNVNEVREGDYAAALALIEQAEENCCGGEVGDESPELFSTKEINDAATQSGATTETAIPQTIFDTDPEPEPDPQPTPEPQPEPKPEPKPTKQTVSVSLNGLNQNGSTRVKIVGNGVTVFEKDITSSSGSASVSFEGEKGVTYDVYCDGTWRREVKN
jgi:hypothetical protein